MEGVFSGTGHGQMGMMWEQVRAPLIVPFMKIMVIMCLAMSVMLFVERVCMGIIIAVVKLMKYKLEKRYKWEAIKEDLEIGNSCYPMVLVQIPMYNEKEVHYILFLSQVFHLYSEIICGFNRFLMCL